MKWNIPSRDGAYRTAAMARQAILTKPTGALGALEDVAVWLADIQQSEKPVAGPAAAIVFAADHPVSHLGVSAYPREVTPMMVMNVPPVGPLHPSWLRLNGIPLCMWLMLEPNPTPILKRDRDALDTRRTIGCGG